MLSWYQRWGDAPNNLPPRADKRPHSAHIEKIRHIQLFATSASKPARIYLWDTRWRVFPGEPLPRVPLLGRRERLGLSGPRNAFQHWRAASALPVVKQKILGVFQGKEFRLLHLRKRLPAPISRIYSNQITLLSEGLSRRRRFQIGHRFIAHQMPEVMGAPPVRRQQHQQPGGFKAWVHGRGVLSLHSHALSTINAWNPVRLFLEAALAFGKGWPVMI